MRSAIRVATLGALLDFRLSAELLGALETFGKQAGPHQTDVLPAGVVTAEYLTSTPDPASPRCVHRLTLSNGHSVKVRRFRRLEHSEEASRWLRALNDPRFAGVHASFGTVWIEEWVDGVVLSSVELGHAEVVDAARFLAWLHGLTEVNGLRVGDIAETSQVLSDLEADLSYLDEHGWLDAAQVRSLKARARDLAPRFAERGLTHNDYCANNLVVTATAGLRVIDNEALGLGFQAFDLARTWSRWEMSGRHWEAFISAYDEASSTPRIDATWSFWQIAALARTAKFFARVRADAPNRGLALLRAMTEPFAKPLLTG